MWPPGGAVLEALYLNGVVMESRCTAYEPIAGPPALLFGIGDMRVTMDASRRWVWLR